MSISPPILASFLVLLEVFNIHYGTTLVSALDSPSPLKLARIQKYLKKINKPAVKSIERHGDTIDCVPIEKQPALDHPLLKDHKIQTVAPETPIFETDGNETEIYALRRDLQVWSQVEHCPEGTIPIRRTMVEDVLRAKSLSHFGKIKPNMPFLRNPSNKQPKINNQVHESLENEEWWLGWGPDTVILGYWPSKLFWHLSAYATLVDYGGEIINARADGQHTQTQMGSGRFPEEGYRKASYFRNIELVSSANTLYSPRSLSPSVTDANCYDIALSSDSNWGTHFYYGGPGRNPNCP